MRSPYVLPVALALIIAGGTAAAQSMEGPLVRNAQFVKQLTASRVQRLGTSAGPDPDTAVTASMSLSDTVTTEPTVCMTPRAKRSCAALA